MDKKIASARKALKLTQEALAKKIKVSASTISSWETGKSEPDEKDIEKLERVLNISLKKASTKKVSSTKASKEVVESTNSIMNILKFAYIIILLVSPILFMIYETKVSVNNFSLLISSGNGQISTAALTDYLVSMYTSVAILYGWYFLSMIINYIFFSIKFKLGEFITVIVEAIIFGLSIKLGTFELSMLFLIPVVSGIFNLIIMKDGK